MGTRKNLARHFVFRFPPQLPQFMPPCLLLMPERTNLKLIIRTSEWRSKPTTTMALLMGRMDDGIIINGI